MFSAEQGVDLHITMSGKTSWPEAAIDVSYSH
jgi:hypothetical protein